MSGDELTQITGDNKSLFGLNVETSFIIAILTAGSFFISYLYEISYYGRLGIYSSLLNFSIQDFILRGILVLMISLVICLSVWYGIRCPLEWNIAGWALCTIPYFLMIISMILLIFQLPNVLPIYTIIFPILLSLYVLYTFINRNMTSKMLWNYELVGKALIIVLILMALGLFSIVLGLNFAKNSIECDGGSCSHLNFTFKDSNLSYINSPNLILITYHDGKYYLSKQEKPAPPDPEIFIVSDDQILSVRMKTVENWSDPNQLVFSN